MQSRQNRLTAAARRKGREIEKEFDLAGCVSYQMAKTTSPQFVRLITSWAVCFKWLPTVRRWRRIFDRIVFLFRSLPNACYKQVSFDATPSTCMPPPQKVHLVSL